MADINNVDRYRHARRVTLIGAFINLFLGIIKTLGGIVFYSHALVADGIHSFADLFTDLMVVFASKFGSEEADTQHPYGHQRIETAATLLLSLFLIIAGGAIGWDAILALFSSVETPEKIAIAIAFISIVANEGLFHFTRAVGEKIKSDLLVVNAWHHRSDSLSSVVVAIGLLGTWFGFAHLDAVAAIIVAIMIIKMGWDYSWDSVKELIDTAVDAKIVNQIEHIICSVDGVSKMHQLRTRSMGGDVYIDVHVQVEPKISVSEGHHIAQNVHQTLIKKIEHVKDVTVHIDPEDDEEVCPSFHLPSRAIMEKKLLNDWQAQYPQIEDFIIHYLDGNMFIDVLLTDDKTDLAALKQALMANTQQFPEIKAIRVLKSKTVIAN